MANSNDPENFGRVAKIFIDPKANEAYVADGYFNKRVAVVDMDSGKIKRYWGAYGNKPDDAPLARYDPKAPLAQQFRTPVHCAELSTDGFVYVCDRPNDRIQVFTKEGKFVKEKQLFPETLSDGSVWDIAFSRDPQQRFLYVADGANEHVYIVDRNSLEVLSQFGTGGRQPGSSSACTASRPIRRATSTRPKPTPVSVCRSSSSRAWAGDERQAGRAVARSRASKRQSTCAK